jgi:hypothetical protein
MTKSEKTPKGYLSAPTEMMTLEVRLGKSSKESEASLEYDTDNVSAMMMQVIGHNTPLLISVTVIYLHAQDSAKYRTPMLIDNNGYTDYLIMSYLPSPWVLNYKKSQEGHTTP